MAAAVPVMMAVGTGLSVYSQVQQGRAAQAEAETEAAWQEYNARVAEGEARLREQQAAVQTGDARRQAQQTQARQRAQIAASGLATTGTPLEVMNETAANLERSILEVSRRGAMEAQQFRSQAGINLFQAETAKLRGRNAMKAAYIDAASTAFQGGTKTASYIKNDKK